MPDCNQLPLNTVHIQREVEEFILMEVLKCIKVVSKPVQCPTPVAERLRGLVRRSAVLQHGHCAVWRHCTVGNQVNLATPKLIILTNNLKIRVSKKFILIL